MGAANDQIISLKDACWHIAKAVQSPEGVNSYFVLAGAGISWPQVPLASQIIAHCKEVSPESLPEDDAEAKDALTAYSYWMSKAFPHPVQRQRYLRSLIENRPISKANLRLAHILGSGKLTNLVVTPNFDDFLPKSLQLFGFPFLLCDHPYMVDRINPGAPDLQVAHVHGSYWFYDCCNLKAEVTRRASLDADPALTMASLLSSILSNRVPIVVGYSGWEGDVFMDALKRRLAGRRLPYNLIWFLYKDSELDCLPEWLTDHQDVLFVSPDRSKEATGPISTEDDEDGTEAPTDATLPAHVVFDHIIGALKLDEPEAISDPLSFLARQLAACIADQEENADDDVYFIPQVIARVTRARKLEIENLKETQQQLEAIRNATRASRYAESINLARELRVEHLQTEDLEALSSVLSSALTQSRLSVALKIDGYKTLIAALTKLNTDYRKENLGALISAKLNFAFQYYTLSSYVDALSLTDQVVLEHGQFIEQDKKLKSEVASLKVRILFRQGLYEDARAYADVALHDLEPSKKPDVLYDLAIIHCIRGGALAELGLGREAQDTLQRALVRIRSNSKYPMSYWVDFAHDKLRDVELLLTGLAAYNQGLDRALNEFASKLHKTWRVRAILDNLRDAIKKIKAKDYDDAGSLCNMALSYDHERPQQDTHVALGLAFLVKAIATYGMGNKPDGDNYLRRARYRLSRSGSKSSEAWKILNHLSSADYDPAGTAHGASNREGEASLN